MARVANIHQARTGTRKNISINDEQLGFTPCSQDMTICGDCTDNRAKKKCPRLKEWLAKRKTD